MREVKLFRKVDKLLIALRDERAGLIGYELGKPGTTCRSKVWPHLTPVDCSDTAGGVA